MIEIIPAIDLVGGRCVRLSQGDFQKKTVYEADPLSQAKEFEAAGFRRLHIVDLDGARRGEIAHLRLLEAIAKTTSLTIDYGGGVKNEEDVDDILSAGAAMVTIGSLAVSKPEVFFNWVKKYGSDAILLGADARNEQIAVNGWQEATTLNVVEFLRVNFDMGVRHAFVTDISADGMLNGPGIRLYAQIRDSIPDLNLIASGGVGSVQDIRDLDGIGCSGVIVGKAFYEGRIMFKDLGEFVGL